MADERPWPTSPYINGMWPHYWSTYCMHEKHADCRFTCKHCAAECQCPCHEAAPHDGGQDA